jgi:hypothetical protein
MYGQTTSGKTYTMLGYQDNPGILPFALLDIFKEIVRAGFRFNFEEESEFIPFEVFCCDLLFGNL